MISNLTDEPSSATLNNVTSYSPSLPQSTSTTNFEEINFTEMKPEPVIKTETPDEMITSETSLLSPMQFTEPEPVIKQETPDEPNPNETSLLVPLFEMLVNEVKNEVKNSSAKPRPRKRKAEKITATPLSLDNFYVSPQSRNGKSVDEWVDEDTDSASETLSLSAKRSIKRKRIQLKKVGLTKRARQGKGRTERSKVRARKIKRRKKSSVIPVKLSEAKHFMEGWPTLSVDVVDLCSFNQ